jgi:hypothetical protein
MNHDTRHQRTASLTAGVALALMTVIAPISVFGAIGTLIIPGDATQTVQNITESQSLFRWGIAGLILVVILDVVVAVALITLFRPVNRSLSTMAAAFRLTYAGVYLVAIIQLVVALGLLGDANGAMRALDAYDTIWHVGLILFGVHLLLIGFLAYRSGFMAKVFGILLVVAGLGYLADGFVLVLVPGPSVSIGLFTFIGEVAFTCWLLIKGSRKDFSVGDDAGRELQLDAPADARPASRDNVAV